MLFIILFIKDLYHPLYNMVPSILYSDFMLIASLHLLAAWENLTVSDWIQAGKHTIFSYLEITADTCYLDLI